ncbi:MAG: hypothetical protein ACRD51_05075, partial [Candidatus Acidiferrum sp.]
MSTAAQSRAHNGKPPGIAREAWNFVAHPTAFFGARLQDKPNWAPALAAPILCAALQFASALLMSEKTQPIVRDLLIKQNMQAIDMHSFGVVAAVAASASYLVTCGMITLAVVCLDVLLK